MRLLLTGASGFVGSHFVAKYADNFDTTGTTYHQSSPSGVRCERIDLTDAAALRELYGAIKPDLVIHAAALSRVLDCEARPELAQQINVGSTETLALLCRKDHVKLIYFSSDQVFDGARGMYRSTDEPRPINQYGRTKLLAEHVVLDAAERNLVFRSNSIVGKHCGWGESFTDIIWKTMEAGQPFRAFQDQYRSPIHITHSLALLFRCVADDVRGILHAGGAARLQRVDLANCMLDLRNSRGKIESISLREHPQAEIMPVDTSYELERLELCPHLAAEPLADLLRRDYQGSE